MNNEQIEIEAKQSARRRRLRTAWKIVRYVFIALVIVVNVAIVWRLCSSSDPSSMSRLLINDRIYDAFEENNEDLKIFRQYHDTITRVERNYGYFSITDSIFIPDAEQAQVVFRYNNSTLDSVAKDYNLDEPLSRDEVHFDVSLVIVYKDGSKVRIQADKEYLHDTKTFYNYYRYNFDSVKIDESVRYVFVDIYYLDDLDYEKQSYGTLWIYDSDKKKIDISLSGADRNALVEYGKAKAPLVK